MIWESSSNSPFYFYTSKNVNENREQILNRVKFAKGNILLDLQRIKRYNNDEGGIKLKKKYVVILLVVLIIILIIGSAIVINEKRKNDESEAVQIFEKRAAVTASVEDSYENVEEIQKNIENMKYVKNVTFNSNEDKVEDFKDKFDSEELFDNEELEELLKGVPASFIIQFDIDSVDDFEELKTVEDDLIQINGIDKVEADGCKEIIEVYEATGIKGLREYDKIYTIMDEQGEDGIINGVPKYLDEHPETRELLKDFIHF